MESIFISPFRIFHHVKKLFTRRNAKETKTPVARGINIANRLRKFYVFPTGGYTEFPDTNGYIEYADDETEYRPFENPLSECTGWEVGSSGFGIVYAIHPRFAMSKPPLRLEVVIPDQTEWPAELWSKLGARDSVHMNDERIKQLGIARYLCMAMCYWSVKNENFEDYYQTIQFGSILRLPRITDAPADLKFELRTNEHLWRCMLSPKSLQDLWGRSSGMTPPEIEQREILFRRQLSRDVVLVSFPGADDKLMVFKSTNSCPAILYHEIKTLLTIPPHRNIIGPPEHIVTVSLFPSTENLVCGFLMPYHECGSLDEILPNRRLDGTLNFQQQLSWALDLTSALIHVRSVPGQFYSDLRMDQIVVARDEDGNERAVLVDFEQNRNVYNWAAPEIYYLEWIAELGDPQFMRTDELDESVKEKFSNLLNGYLESRKFPLPIAVPGDLYDNPSHGWYFPWLSSNDQEKESAMVYQLGKALWCLFEGFGDADIILGRSNIHEAEQRFPEFRRTPDNLRQVITDCTAGAREWIDGHIKIYRHGGKIFPLGKTGLNGEPEGTTDETKDVIRAFWHAEMAKAEAFVLSRQRHDKNQATEADMELLHYLRRPQLKEVLRSLQKLQQPAL